jgi:hypothetical protein
VSTNGNHNKPRRTDALLRNGAEQIGGRRAGWAGRASQRRPPERKEEQQEGQLALQLAYTGPETDPPGAPQDSTSGHAVEHVEGAV